mmetsp:Transcript_16238/g.52367  ORF Transcript_16238/g.52367 Transcript_16238/m.52367 type:complete len:418 (-) Transcript_16238:267-1520(-)
MRLLKRSGDAFVHGKSNAAGEVRLLPEHEEDLWHAYNLIVVGDCVAATTFRKVQRETVTGSTTSERLKIQLRIEVRRVDFDPEAGELRLGGVITADGQVGALAEGLRLGAAHTLQLEVSRPFSLSKEEWDTVALERLLEASNDTPGGGRAELAAVLLQPGLANVCLISHGMSVVKARVESHLPRRGNAAMATAAAKATDKWRAQVLAALLQHTDLDALKALVVAGPGFAKDDFVRWATEEAARRGGEEGKKLARSLPKWLAVHASSAHKHALREVLADPAIAARVADTKAAGEVAALAEFLTLLTRDPDRVAYGYRHVLAATEQGAVHRLLLSDNLFRARSLLRRRQAVSLVESARASGAALHVFSSHHVSGAQLASFSGFAAVLRYALPLDPDDVEDEDEGEEEEGLSAPRTTPRR